MVTGLKLQSPKRNWELETEEGERLVGLGGGGCGGVGDCCWLLSITDSCSREDTVCLMLGHQRGGGGGSFPVELRSLSWRFSRATSKGMISTQPMAPKSAKSRRSSSSEEELSSCISVDKRSSWTNRLRSARSPSRNCRSASDIFGSFNLEKGMSRNWIRSAQKKVFRADNCENEECITKASVLVWSAVWNAPHLVRNNPMKGHTYRAKRNWELWDEDEGLLSPAVAVLAVAVLGGGMVAPVLPGLLPRREAWRPVSTCCRAAWACCRSNCSCIWSCWSWEAEGPDEFICPPAARRTPDSWDNNSAGDNKKQASLLTVST